LVAVLSAEEPARPPVALPLTEPLLPAPPETPEVELLIPVDEVHEGAKATTAASRLGKVRVEGGSPVLMRSSEGKRPYELECQTKENPVQNRAKNDKRVCKQNQRAQQELNLQPPA
jgi:hypothetical protein